MAYRNITIPLPDIPAVSRLRDGMAPRRASFANVDDFIAEIRPTNPVHLARPHVIGAAAQWFMQNFPGNVLYAVKANPSPYVLQTLWAAGMRDFDVASLSEVELVAGLLPKARLHFMHPIKSREAIRKSYFDYGVRTFVIDSEAELFKLLEETRSAKDLAILVRLAVSNKEAFHPLDRKFGIELPQAAELLQQARKVAARVGIAFHVGQQTMTPDSYVAAIAQVGEMIRLAKVNPDIVDIGGGFPVSFPGLVPPPLHSYMDAVKQAIAALRLPKKTKIWCEPGRALVQESGSLIVKVELRKDNRLYINDGLYGALFDASIMRMSFPMRAVRPDKPFAAKQAKFYLLGPTCDSLDALKVPVSLPHDIEEGDWLEIGQTGGYAVALQSRFNGFGAEKQHVVVKDMPLLTTPGFWDRSGETGGTDAATIIPFPFKKDKSPRVQIRPLQSEDFAEVGKLYQDHIAAGLRLVDSGTRDALRRHIDETWLRQAMTALDSLAVVMKINGKVAGFGQIAKAKGRRRDTMRTFRINVLCVARQYQGQDGEILLLHHLENFARQAGGDRILSFVPGVSAPSCLAAEDPQTKLWADAGYDAGDAPAWTEFKTRACGVMLRGLEFVKVNLAPDDLKPC